MSTKMTMRNTKRELYEALRATQHENSELEWEVSHLEGTITELRAKAQTTSGRKAAYQNMAQLRKKYAPAACKHYGQRSVTLSELDAYIDEIALVD